MKVTGKAVIYTKDGVKVVDAEVQRRLSANRRGSSGSATKKLRREISRAGVMPPKISGGIRFGNRA